MGTKSIDRTIETYNASAEKLAEYFKGIGSRIEDIERALVLAGAPENARVVEIGCGDGRDAQEILKRVAWYRGIDPSGGLLAIAREIDSEPFILARAQEYEYPENLDVIYAFASLLHVSKEELPQVFERAKAALRVDGIFYISLKERDQYQEELRRDDFGERVFYFYSPDLIREIAGDGFETAHEDRQHIGNTDWFTLALRKK